MSTELEGILELLRDSVNYEDWDKVEDAIIELETLQEQDLLDGGYDSLVGLDDE